MTVQGIVRNAVLALFVILCSPVLGWCETEKQTNKDVTLDEVVVQGKQGKGVLEAKETQPNTESTITKEGLNLWGGPGQINPYQALDILPSVNYQGTDPYGLSYTQSIKVRGQTGILSTVEGIQLNAGLSTPGVGDRWYFDMENVSQITLYRGAVSPEYSLGPYNTSGSVDRTILRPSDKLGFAFNQSVGSFAFSRSFARFDSGLLPTGTKLFASMSRTYSDKWKGEGHYDGDILSFGLTQNISPNVKVEVFGTHSEPETNIYRSLTYAQTKQLGFYNRYDYNSTLTGNAKKDVNYYDYNKVNFANTAFFGNVEVKLPAAGRLVFKPFYMRSTGSVFNGMGSILGSAGVREWVIDFTLYGLNAQYDVKLAKTNLAVGYWYYNQEPPGPPTAYRVYRANNYGLNYTGWSLLSKATQNYVTHSPYVSADRWFGDFRLRGGLRYVYERIPSINLYNTTGIPGVDYDDATGYTTANSMGSVSARCIRELLPNFGIDYKVNKEINTYFNYGRNFGRPSVEAFSTYASNANAFAKKGVPAQALWNNVKPEISDNFDLGARYNNDIWHVTGTLFYSKYNDKAVNVAEPISGIKYNQNIGEAQSYGGELEASVDATKSLNIFATAYYNKFEFTRDITTSPTTVTRAKGKQVPDVPEYGARVGATYRFLDGFAASSIVRYVGERYGDVENNERVPSYATLDADVRYTKRDFLAFESVTASLGFYNLLNSRYISVITVSDDTKQGNASYYTGAPLTVVGRIDLKF